MNQPTSKRGEITALTALRGAAAIWVVLYHLNRPAHVAAPAVAPYLSGYTGTGYLGVDLFFVLSGFVIAYTYFDSLRPFAWRNYFGFVRNRFARIYPAYLVIILAVTGASVWRALAAGTLESPPVRKLLGILGRQLLMVHSWSVPVRMTVNLTTWSVSAEWLAYVTFPLVVFLVARLRSARAMLAWAVVYACIGAAFIDRLDHYRPVQVGLLRIAIAFPLGVLAYRLYALKPQPSRAWALAAVGLLLCFGPVAQFIMKPRHISPVTVAPTVFAVVVYGLARADFAWTAKRLPRWLGQVSYCLYLVHLIAIGAIKHRLSPKHVAPFGTLAGLGYLAGCVLVALACAHALHAWVERPCQVRLAVPRAGRPTDVTDATNASG